jgi:hypothetical protein
LLDIIKLAGIMYITARESSEGRDTGPSTKLVRAFELSGIGETRWSINVEGPALSAFICYYYSSYTKNVKDNNDRYITKMILTR